MCKQSDQQLAMITVVQRGGEKKSANKVTY